MQLVQQLLQGRGAVVQRQGVRRRLRIHLLAGQVGRVRRGLDGGLLRGHRRGAEEQGEQKLGELGHCG